MATMRAASAPSRRAAWQRRYDCGRGPPLPQAELLSLYDEAFADDTFDSPADRLQRALPAAGRGGSGPGLSASEMALRDSPRRWAASPATRGAG